MIVNKKTLCIIIIITSWISSMVKKIPMSLFAKADSAIKLQLHI